MTVNIYFVDNYYIQNNQSSPISYLKILKMLKLTLKLFYKKDVIMNLNQNTFFQTFNPFQSYNNNCYNLFFTTFFISDELIVCGSLNIFNVHAEYNVGI